MDPKADNDYNLFERLPNDSLVNLEFRDVTYAVMDHSGKNTKNILNGVSGEFRAGELSAIMGPSGCGKSTLLNCLSGYRIHKTSGDVKVNSQPQNMKAFHKCSRYILQDDHISPHFTIGETMMFASQFKLDEHYTKEQRQTVIDDILDIFQLRQHSSTTIGLLSGGQRKRVCIALELMDKPAVLFLDEPTTVFILAEGQCIYQGAGDYVVPYLQQFNLHCPITYNPADFIIETATYAYGNFHKEMVREMCNGKIFKWNPRPKEIQTEHLKNGTEVVQHMDLRPSKSSCSSSWWFEYTCLYRRITQQIWRDKANMKLRILVQLLVALMTGWAYAGIGNNAKFAISNYYFVLLTILQFVFMCTLPMFAHVPREMQYLRREYFNRWYRLSSYFIALLTSQIPVITIMCLVCSAFMYFVTDQPMEMFRFGLFFIMTFLTSMVASTFGLLIGSRFSLLNALFIGPNITSVWVVFSNLGLEKPQPTLFETILMETSYLKHSMEGILATLFKFNRPDMKCPSEEIFCFFLKPKYLLRLLGSSDVNYLRAALFLIGFYALFMASAYANFKSRLDNSEFSIKNRHYRYIKHKIKQHFYFKMF